MKVADDLLTVDLQGIDQFWALRRRIRVPLTHVRGIERTPHRTWRSGGFRVLGAQVPGLLRVGRFSYHGERVFWAVHHPERTIEVELVSEPFDRLIVEVENPHETTREVQRAMARRSAARSDRSLSLPSEPSVHDPPQFPQPLDHVGVPIEDRVLRRKRGGDAGQQKAVATSGQNSTIIYVPAGANGVPLVQGLHLNFVPAPCKANVSTSRVETRATDMQQRKSRVLLFEVKERSARSSTRRGMTPRRRETWSIPMPTSRL